MKKKILYAAAVLLVVAVAFYLGTRSGSSSPPAYSHGNIFVGKMLGAGQQAQSFSGARVLSDQGCTRDPRTGLANCTAGISASGGTLYFNYEHDMMAQPCLSEGDVVSLQVSGNGSATVTRTYWGGGGA